MDLGLDIRTQGRPARPVTGEVVRELSLADLALLEVEKGVAPAPIQRLRDSHHALARALAEGLTPAQASLRTGYSSSRISILQKDPAFQDLVSTYREGVQELFTDVQGRLASLSGDALTIIQERILEREGTEKEASLKELTQIAQLALDRSGNGPQSKSTNVNINVDLAGRLEAARRRAGLLEGTVATTPAVPAPLSVVSTPPVGATNTLPTGENPDD